MCVGKRAGEPGGGRVGTALLFLQLLGGLEGGAGRSVFHLLSTDEDRLMVPLITGPWMEPLGVAVEPASIQVP